MGDYTYLRGTAKIKKRFKEEVRPLFTRGNREDCCGQKSWAEGALLAETPFMETLIQHGSSVPGGWSTAVSGFGSEEDRGILEYDDEGCLTFCMAFKNYKRQQEAFVALLVMISDEYEIEQDYHEEVMFRDYERDYIYSWSHTYQTHEKLIEALEHWSSACKSERGENPVRKFAEDSFAAERLMHESVVNEIMKVEDSLIVQQLKEFLPLLRRQQLRKFNRRKKQRRARCK